MNARTLSLVGLFFCYSFLYSNNPYLSLEVSCQTSLIFFVSDSTCTASFDIPEPDATGGCTNNIGYAISGDFMNFSNLDVALGTYFAIIEVFDECGDTVECEVVLEVQDSVVPVAVCKTNFFVEFQFNSFFTQVWATDLDDGSFDNCSSNLQYSLSSDINDTSIVFTCCDIGTQFLELWVTNESGNQSSCLSYFELFDPFMNMCEVFPEFSGHIYSINGEGMEDVLVYLENSNDSLFELTYSGGLYWFSDIYLESNITPSFDENPMNGVSTFDMVLIQKHILGITLLDNPYKLIAADVNNSGTVTTFDVLIIRQLILGIIQDFPDNSSWRFVEEIYEFPEPQDPWQEIFPESVFADDFYCGYEYDFIGIKIGDVNGSAIPNGE